MEGEPIEALSQMAQQKHRIMNIEEGDSVYLAIRSLIWKLSFDTLNELVRAGAYIILTIKRFMHLVMVAWKN